MMAADKSYARLGLFVVLGALGWVYFMLTHNRRERLLAAA